MKNDGLTGFGTNLGHPAASSQAGTAPPVGAQSANRLATTLALLRAHWVVVVIVVLAVPALVAAVSAVLPKTYQAHSAVFVSVNSGSDVVSLSQGSSFSEERLQSYIGLVTTNRVMSAVITDLDLKLTPAQLAGKIRAEAQPETVLLDIYASDASPRRAARIANSVTSHFISFAERLEKPPAGGARLVRLSTIETATPPQHAASPDLLRNTAFAVPIGLVVACVLLWVLRLLDTKVRDPQAAARAACTPLLARVPEDRAAAGRRLGPALRTASAFAEAIRLLRTRLRFADVSAPVRTLLVTSVGSREGKTMISTYLAAAMSEGGARVLVIDADLRRPALAARLGLEQAVGLTTVLAHQATIGQAVQHHEQGGFDVLAAGIEPPNPSEVLDSPAMRALLDELRRDYDCTIIDSAPAGATADAAILGTVADAFVFVVRSDGSVRTEGLVRTHQQLTAVGARSLGMIANFCADDVNAAKEYYQ